MRLLSGVLIGALFPFAVGATTITRSFGIEDLGYVQLEAIRSIDSIGRVFETDTQGRLGTPGLEAFDESAHGALRRVTITMNYDLGTFVSAEYSGQDNLDTPGVRVAGAFQVTRNFAVRGLGTGTSVGRFDTASEIFAIDTDDCVAPPNGLRSCFSSRDIALDGGRQEYTFSGAALDIFRLPHIFTNAFTARLLDTDGTTIENSYSLRLLSEPTSFSPSIRSATFSITYDTAPTPVPLPAGAGLLLGALAAMMLIARRRAS